MAFKQPSREIQSVQTAFELIHVLQALGGASPRRLTEELEISKSALHNYLGTLEQMGYVINEGGTYRLGLRFLTHGIASKRSIQGGELIVNELDSIADDLTMPTWWVTEEIGRGFFLDVAIPEQSTPIYGQVGKRSYLHTHAPGKAILAEFPKAYVENIIDYQGLPPHTDQTIVDPEALFEDLETIRNEGFAVSKGGAALGIRSVGVGFKDGSDRRHALGVFGESPELTDTRIETFGKRLQDSANSLQTAFRNGGL